MNRLTALITDIQRTDSITIVSFDAETQPMCMMALELSPKLVVGSKVIVGAKSTNIALSRKRHEALSIENQLEVTVSSINMGALLCSVSLEVSGQQWESVITRESALTMQLAVGEKVIALISASDLSIVEQL